MALRTSGTFGRRNPAVAVAAAALLAAACSAPQYVAWPRTRPPARPAPRAGELGPVVIHAPFADGRCRVCHVSPDGGGSLLHAAEQLCDDCHAEEVRRAVPHQATRSCLGCHAPHVSMVEGRIAGSEERMCVRCHAASAGKLARAHQGYPIDGARCTRCHDPHGGAADGLLRTHLVRPALRTPIGAAAPERARPRLAGAR